MSGNFLFIMTTMSSLNERLFIPIVQPNFPQNSILSFADPMAKRILLALKPLKKAGDFFFYPFVSKTQNNK
jgi:hypothetical protein